jgi:SAM-dependent methyltransferase
VIILNLACGTKTSEKTINIDWSWYLVIKKRRILSLLSPLFLSRQRRQDLAKIKGPIIAHNLLKGIPFNDSSVDAVYHSQFLEHLDRDQAKKFLLEIKRVLKPEGIQRIVVPDFEVLCKRYIDHIHQCSDSLERAKHESYVAAIIEQCVREEPVGLSQQTGWKRFLEKILLGDTKKRGERHRWMYDRISLADMLERAGFRNISIKTFGTSAIECWGKIGLDTEDSVSLYMEAIK